ncbi:MAG: spermidine/putrescine ABC transporter substrate-binding protein, partial [Cytophagales bacterium]|nr:spermidine/putrescine ABC transporter substrate-binding protein [Rhizobacter sp.]
SKRDLARKFIQYSLTPRAQVAMTTKVDNRKSIPSMPAWKLLNDTKPQDAQLLRMTLKGPNVMDEYKAKKIQLRQLPKQQSIEDWNETWSQFKSL